MSTVIFETEKAIFSFDLAVVLDLLAFYSSHDHVVEANARKRVLESKTDVAFTSRRVFQKARIMEFWDSYIH